MLHTFQHPRKGFLSCVVIIVISFVALAIRLLENIRFVNVASVENSIEGYTSANAPATLLIVGSKSNYSVVSVVVPKEQPGTWWTHWELKRDLHLYNYLINPTNNCAHTKFPWDNTESLILLILVKSAPGHLKLRDAIRATYIQGAVKHNVSCRTFFLLGYPGHDDKKQAEIVKEAETHGDIIQEDFVDSYYNLTTKIIMGFKWAATFCKNSQFVMLIDDDVMVDIVTLIDDLSKAPAKFHSKFVLGQNTRGKGPIRIPSHKWYVPRTVYASDIFPDYPQGHGYIFSQDVAHLLYHASKELPPPVPWEDVYCGMLLKKTAIPITDRKPWFRQRHWSSYRKPWNPLTLVGDYFKIELSVEKMFNVWEAIESERIT